MIYQKKKLGNGSVPFPLELRTAIPNATGTELQTPVLPPLHILVVDAITPNSDLLHMILESAGDLKEEACTGLEALWLFVTADYNL